ncbi:MAG: HAMP domain-containing sensor histidine kinase [Nakamurella sp.]
MRFTLTVRRKFVVALAGVALVVAALVGFIGYTFTSHVLGGEIDRSLASAASTLDSGGQVSTPAVTTAVPRGGEGDGTSDGGPGGRRGDRGEEQGIVQAAQTVNETGAITVLVGFQLPVGDASAALNGAGSAATYVETVNVDGIDYRVLTTARVDENGIIMVARDLTITEGVLSRLAWNSAWIGLGVLLLAAAAGWLIARQITRRLTALTTAAEQIGVTGSWELGVESAGRDEVARLGAAMQGMLGELARSRQDQQRLVQDAGHELRTPLTSLRTNVSVLKRYDELSSASRVRLLEDVQSEARELTDMVNELVELASDRRDVEEFDTVDLALVAERVVSLYRRRTSREIVLTTSGTTVTTARQHAVERALSNLVDNAIKFDGGAEAVGSGPVEVDVDGTTVTVSDRGPGLAATDTERVFDRFYRSDVARSLPGSGLGLAIVRDTAATHSGTVSAANRPGGGAVIRFTVGGAAFSPNDNLHAGTLSP